MSVTHAYVVACAFTTAGFGQPRRPEWVGETHDTRVGLGGRVGEPSAGNMEE